MRTRRLVGALLVVVAIGVVLWRVLAPGSPDAVVVYVSHDQVFSEPILRDFERDTGIRVKAVYDTEETKSAGAMNRLIAEKANPQADIYWANEPIRAEVLRQQGVSAPYRSPSAEQSGKKLIDCLLWPETEKKLAYSDAAQIPLHSGVDAPPGVP